MFLFRIDVEIEGLGVLTSIAKFSCVWKRLVNLCNLSGLRDCIDQVKFFKNVKGKLTISSACCKQNTVELKNCSFSLKILRRE